ncbi:MAG: hypothetical protein QXV79_04480 [Thermofilaceae archaeon]
MSVYPPTGASPKEVAKEVWEHSPRYEKFIKGWLFADRLKELCRPYDLTTLPTPTLVKRAGSTLTISATSMTWTSTEGTTAMEYAFFPFPSTPRAVYVHAIVRTNRAVGIGLALNENYWYRALINLPAAASDFVFGNFLGGSGAVLGSEAVDLSSGVYYIVELAYDAVTGLFRIYRDGDLKFVVRDLSLVPDKFMFTASVASGYYAELRAPLVVWWE